MRSLIHRETGTSERTPLRQSDSTDESIAESGLFRFGRVLFGAVLAVMATDNFRNLEGRIQYAESKDAPIPSLSVPAASGGLLFGGLGVALWRVPVASAAAVAAFFAGTTPLMHDFWEMDDPEMRQQEFFHFAKNTALLGAALAFLKLGLSEASEE